MKALSLWQPWATLVAIGAKRVEMRYWPAPHWLMGQRIAIHATKTTRHLWICKQQPFAAYLRAAERLPLGAVIATVVVDGCSEITTASAAELAQSRPHEYAFGDYAPGRFAWVLRDVQLAVSPLLVTGRQGIFDVPGELSRPEHIPRQLTVDDVLADWHHNKADQ